MGMGGGPWQTARMAQDGAGQRAAGHPVGRRPPRGGPRRDTPRPAGPPPAAAARREAALAHLARFAATEAGLARVLARRVDRWARRAEAEAPEARDRIAAAAAAAKSAAREVARALAGAGVVDDAAFAEARARRLSRAGRSRRAIAAHLAAKGVEAETARGALPEDAEAELDAALALCRRRRIGPFARDEADAPARLKALGALARAGFPQDVARRALEMDPAEAGERLLASRRG
jgi:regulatory protein